MRPSLSILALLACTIAFGQSSPDSIRDRLLNHQQQDSTRFHLLIEYAKSIRISSPDTAIAVAQDALRLARELRETRFEAIACNVIGTAYFYQGDYKSAATLQQDAIALSRRYGHAAERATAIGSLANVNRYLGNYAEAINNYFEALKLEDSLHNDRGIIKTYTNLAQLYRNLGDFSNAIRYSKRALELLEETSPDWIESKAAICNTLGSSYLDDERYDSALIYLRFGLNYNKATGVTGNVTFIANSLSNMAYCFNKTSPLDSAVFYINQALQLTNQISSQAVLSALYVNAAAIRLRQGKNAEALELARRAIQTAARIGAREVLLNGYVTLTEIYAREGNYKKAYEYSMQAYLLGDTLKNQEVQQRSANAQLDYELMTRQYRIEKLNQESLLVQTQIAYEQRVKLYFIVISGLLTISVIIILMNWRLKVRTNKRLLQHTGEIEMKNKALDESNRFLQDQSLRSQMKPHFVFNALNSIQYLILERNNDQAFEYLGKFSTLLRTSLELSELDTVELDREIGWIRLYLELESLRFRDHFNFSIRYLNPTEVFSGVRVPPFLIQPFAENALVHGLMTKQGPRQLTIDLSRTHQKLKIQIIDNGIGREQARQKRQPKHRSFGVELIQKRLDNLSALTGKQFSLSIDDNRDVSGATAGTIVTLELPL